MGKDSVSQVPRGALAREAVDQVLWTLEGLTPGNRALYLGLLRRLGDLFTERGLRRANLQGSLRMPEPFAVERLTGTKQVVYLDVLRRLSELLVGDAVRAATPTPHLTVVAGTRADDAERV